MRAAGYEAAKNELADAVSDTREVRAMTFTGGVRILVDMVSCLVWHGRNLLV